MLKHRIEGLVWLHGAMLFVAVAVAFIASVAVVDAFGLISFTTGVNLSVYFAGVLGAMVWIHHNLTGIGSKLGSMTFIEVFRLTIQQLTRLMVVIFTLAFAIKDIYVSRAFLLGFVGVAGFIMLVGNTFLPRFLTKAFFGQDVLRTVVFSSQEESDKLQAWLKSCGELGVEIIGFISDQDCSSGLLPKLGSSSELKRVIREFDVDQILVDQKVFGESDARAFTRSIEQTGCRVRFYVNMATLFSGAPAMVEGSGSYSFAAYTPEPLENPVNRLLKRCFDIAVSLPVVLFVLPPLTLTVWAVHRVQSPGPVFYRQYRSGLNRRRFEILKFRSMHANLDHLRSQQATKNDVRVFAFGRLLRKTSLDELPQFLNVLMGQMSVNGPRPHLIEHDEMFAQVVASYRKRHFVKPGITGLAQSKGYRGEISDRRLIVNRVRYDMYYVARWSLGLDIKILFNTFKQVLFPPKTAY